MKRLRLAAALVALLLWLPTFFGLSYGALLWNALTGRAGAPAPQIAALPAPQAAPAPAAPPAVAVAAGPPREAALLDPAGLTAARSVTVLRTLPLAALLAPGEPVPGPAYRDLYAEARAGALAQAECPLLVESLAIACRPLAVGATPLGNGDYRVSLQLGVALQDGPGPLDPDEALERAAVSTVLDIAAARGVAAEDLAAARATVYRAALYACFVPRATGTACTFADLEVETAASPDQPDRFDVTGRLRLAIARKVEGG